MPGAATRSTTRFSKTNAGNLALRIRKAVSFLSEKSFCFGQLGTICTGQADRSELRIEGLRHGGVSGSLGSARGTKERIETIR